MKKERIFEKKLISADGQNTVSFVLRRHSLKNTVEIRINGTPLYSEEITFSVNYWVKEFSFEGKTYSAVIKELERGNAYEFMCYCDRTPFSESPKFGELCALINDPYHGQNPDDVNRMKSADLSGKLIAFLLTAVAIILIDGARSHWWESLLHIGIISALWGVYHLLDGIGDRKSRRALLERLNGNGSMPSK